MQDKMWIVYLCLGVLAFSWVLSWFIGAYSSFRMLLYRKSKEKWARGVPARDKGVELAMYEAGCAWAKEHADRKRDVHIQRDGLDFYGEFFDFGGDQCVMILPGRRDGLCDSYYYGIPYAQRGWSVLVVDTRAHGFSGGDYCTYRFSYRFRGVGGLFFRLIKSLMALTFFKHCVRRYALCCVRRAFTRVLFV